MTTRTATAPVSIHLERCSNVDFPALGRRRGRVMSRPSPYLYMPRTPATIGSDLDHDTGGT